jgi:hypothetical protein
MTKRTDMSTLHNIPLFVREPREGEIDTRGDFVALCRANDRDTIVAIIHREDMFDPHGNRFACN